MAQARQSMNSHPRVAKSNTEKSKHPHQIS